MEDMLRKLSFNELRTVILENLTSDDLLQLWISFGVSILQNHDDKSIEEKCKLVVYDYAPFIAQKLEKNASHLQYLFSKAEKENGDNGCSRDLQ